MNSPKVTPTKQFKTQDVTLYDKYNYNYSTYWTTRTYEHDAEVHALTKLLHQRKGNWFIDIGGSYGRHIPLYHRNFTNGVLLDYSLNSLRQAQKTLKQNSITNIFPIAANAYHLPFKQNVFDAGMMIRVIHHLKEPHLVFDEIHRTFTDEALFILEFPNKFHLKSVLKALLRADGTYLTSENPINVNLEHPEGTNVSDPGIMLNYAPRHIKKLLRGSHFNVDNSTAVSFLRIPFLKKTLGTSAMKTIEHILQGIFGWTTITPSIIFGTTVNKTRAGQKGGTDPKANLLDTILACPSCKSDLSSNGKQYTCAACSLRFPVTSGIPDLRYPQDELS